MVVFNYMHLDLDGALIEVHDTKLAFLQLFFLNRISFHDALAHHAHTGWSRNLPLINQAQLEPPMPILNA